MTKTKIRENIFKILFRAEFNELDEMPSQMDFFFDEEAIEEEDMKAIRAKSTDILSKLDMIDAALNDKVTGWDTSRMGKVELTILRLAIYEIQNDESVPTKVAINEAVELAKRFGQDNSPSFVNGVLAKFA